MGPGAHAGQAAQALASLDSTRPLAQPTHTTTQALGRVWDLGRMLARLPKPVHTALVELCEGLPPCPVDDIFGGSSALRSLLKRRALGRSEL